MTPNECHFLWVIIYYTAIDACIDLDQIWGQNVPNTPSDKCKLRESAHLFEFMASLQGYFYKELGKRWN